MLSTKTKSQTIQDFLKESLAELDKKNLLRSVEDKVIKEGEISFASNDYLGLAQRSIKSDLPQGSTGSRLTTGTHDVHLELEEYIAKWKKTEAAIFFGSGYLANLGALSVLLNLRDVVYSDSLNHSCILDGIRLSKAKKYNYQHNDMAHLEELMAKSREQYQKAIIVTDTVFSMDGDRARLEEVIDLAEKYNATVYVDEAHAAGVLGETGSGLLEELGCDKYNVIQMGTFSKAVGVEGGYIAGSQDLIDYLRNHARTFMFSTAPSPLIASAVLENLKIINSDEGAKLRSKLQKNISYFKQKLESIPGLEYINEDTAVFAVFVGDIEKTLEVSKKLRESGLVVPAIRPPTVETARLRICLSAAHSLEQIDSLLDSIVNSLS